MLDPKLLRKQPELVARALSRRHHPFDLETFLALDVEQRRITTAIDEKRRQRNEQSQAIGKVKQAGGDIAVISAEVRTIGDAIKALEAQVAEIDLKRDAMVLQIPNVPDDSVPEGADEHGNVEVRKVGTPKAFEFEPQTHDALGVALGIMDFERAAKLAGARFVVMKGWGSRLERALINFMLDLHTTEHGYTEILPPFLANRETLTANGNLPKFEEDLFAVKESDLFLIPTAEVPLTNLYRGEIIEADQLPMYMTAYTPCFRAEAGAAGRDTRGLIRLHQFDKVELVKVVRPESSFDELEAMVKNAETILQRLELPYRVVLLCAGDMGFNSAKTYDLEVWFPSQNKYREISSCSNCTDFQARRGMTRFRPEAQASTEYPHTLNGSGLAVGRTLAALMENHQQPDGSIRIPAALQPYVGGTKEIRL
ncbi:MAG: serine--tRNA ligase [Candidatus Sericytochromatia bacterium]|nr:serine--tRNA ligase [Candidatus Sericytochromatia bacterium]